VVPLSPNNLGQPYGGFPAELQRKVLKGATPRHRRPGEELPPADFPRLRAEADARAARAVTDQQFASYLMYPAVFTEYAANRRRFSDVAILPTPVFFYGMQPGQEISVDLERGKTLIVRYVTQSEPHEDGTRTVFFELNGQPRSVRVTDRSQRPKRAPQRKVDAGNPRHIGAPMPGTVTGINVGVGQSVARGDVVTTLEAMKIEAAVRAEIDGEVAEILVRPAMTVDAKDLLIVLR
jgi:pyruvate carboxylase